MFTVMFDGVEYTKASEVAKEFGYTPDYIGQLCRAKKIDARLVGRTWFVNTDTLHKHKQGRYKNLRNASEKPTTNLKTKETEGSEAESVKIRKTGLASKKYLRRVSAPNARMRKIIEKPADGAGGVRNISLRYEPDENSLIPRVVNSPRVTLLKVDMADSEPIKVQSSNKASILAPEALPDVALSGALSISEISDEEYANSDETTQDTKELGEKNIPEEVEKNESKKSSERDNKENKVKIREMGDDEVAQAEAEVAQVVEELNTDPAEPTTDAKVPVKLKVERAPVVAMTKENSVKNPKNLPTEEIPVTNLDTRVEVVRISFHAPAIGLALGVIVGTLLLSAEQVALVTPEVADFSISFDWSNVSNMALVLFTG